MRKKIDDTNEVEKKNFNKAKKYSLLMTSYLKHADFFIIAVPTPIKKNKEPDLRLQKKLQF